MCYRNNFFLNISDVIAEFQLFEIYRYRTSHVLNIMHCQNPLDFYPLQCFFVESSVMYRNPLDSNYMYE